MKTLITTLNSKFIHKSLSIRLLYVATKKYHAVDFKEYTIKETNASIVEDILEQQVQVIGFSVYIWNVDKIKDICQQLKQKNKDLIIILGGPEVSYEIDYFLDNFRIDYIISGEGEIAFKELLDCLKDNTNERIQGVSTKEQRDYRQTKCVDLSYIESLESPYVLPRDLEDMDKRILYFETSRGCPYRCLYCLSSLEKGMRFFSLEYLLKQLDLLLATNVKTVKFLDRSFNAKTEHALSILAYLCKKHRPNIQFQFEINGDVLDQRIIDYIVTHAPSNLFRFEIGIQSTYEPTNQIVKRYQDFNRLSTVIVQLQNSKKVDLHLDLIAGLPLEDKRRFSKSFDDVFTFYPKELQLGFLKLLRGTGLRKDYEKFGYEFDQNPPYEITKSNDLTKTDIKDIHLVEEMLEKYWNSGKMPLTMNHVFTQVPSVFAFFLDLGNYYLTHKYKMLHFQNDELFMYLDTYLHVQGIHVTHILIEDYLRLSKIKPKRWWEPTLTKVEAKQVLHQLVEEHQLNPETLFRHGLVERFESYDLVAIYKDYQVQIAKYPRVG